MLLDNDDCGWLLSRTSQDTIHTNISAYQAGCDLQAPGLSTIISYLLDICCILSSVLSCKIFVVPGDD